MERQLFVLRHVKSSWNDGAPTDHDRGLAPRGERDLGRLRRLLADRDAPIEVIRCSSAVRALATLAGVQPALPDGVDIGIDPDLYGASVPTLLAVLAGVPEETRGVLVVGHNPGLEDLLRALSGSGAPAAMEQLARKVPTGAFAEIHLAGSWSAIAPGTGHLAALVIPGELPD